MKALPGTLAAGGLLAAAVYLAWGYWFAPAWFEAAMRSHVAERAGLQLEAAQVEFNPFTLRVSVQDAALELDGVRLAFARRADASIAIASFIRFEPVIESVVLAEPLLTIDVAQAAQFDAMATLLPAQGQSAPRVDASQGRLGLIVDGRLIELTDVALNTQPDGSFAFTASIEGAHVELTGVATTNPIGATGHFRTTGIDLARSAPQGAAARIAGTLGGGAAFAWSHADAVLHLQDAHIAIDNMDVQMDGIRWQAPHTEAGFGAQITGASWRELRIADLELAFDRGDVVVGCDERTSSDARPHGAADANRRLGVDAVRAAGFGLDLNLTACGGPTAMLQIADVAVHNLTTATGEPADFSITLSPESGGEVHAQGWVIPAAAETRATVAFSGIDAAAVAAYLMDHGPLAVEQGRLSGETTLTRHNGATRAEGVLEVAGLALADTATQTLIVDDAAVSLRGLGIELSPLRGSIDAIVMRHPTMQVTLGDPDWRQSLRETYGGVDARTFVIEDGRVHLRDERVAPPVEISATVQATIVGQPSERVIDLLLDEIDAAQLSPYAERYAGLAIASGRLRAKVDYTAHGGDFSGTNLLSLDDVALGAPIAGATHTLPLALAQALLEDDQGRINARIPLRVAPDTEERELAQVLGAAFADYVKQVAAAPFAVLGGLVGGDGSLGAIAFPPGNAELSAHARSQLADLAVALRERPRVALGVPGSYDSARDRFALARQQVNLHVGLATSAAAPERAPGAPGLDFNDPKVRVVLDEFAGERLTPQLRGAIEARHASDGAARYRALFEALVDNENIAPRALRSLGRFRALSIIEGLRAYGAAEERLVPTDPIDAAQPAGDSVLVRLEAHPRPLSGTVR